MNNHKQHITLQEWTTYRRAQPGNSKKLIAWIREKRQQEIINKGLGCTFTIEVNYWKWFTIGKMIEFLDEKEHKSDWYLSGHVGTDDGKAVGSSLGYAVRRDNFYCRKDELCDALFEAVKEILETT